MLLTMTAKCFAVLFYSCSVRSWFDACSPSVVFKRQHMMCQHVAFDETNIYIKTENQFQVEDDPLTPNSIRTEEEEEEEEEEEGSSSR